MREDQLLLIEINKMFISKFVSEGDTAKASEQIVDSILKTTDEIMQKIAKELPHKRLEQLRPLIAVNLCVEADKLLLKKFKEMSK